MSVSKQNRFEEAEDRITNRIPDRADVDICYLRYYGEILVTAGDDQKWMYKINRNEQGGWVLLRGSSTTGGECDFDDVEKFDDWSSAVTAMGDHLELHKL